MDISKLKPWNWFKKEEEDQARDLPVKRPSSDCYGPLANLHEEVDRLFNDAFRRFGMPSLFRDDHWLRPTQRAAPSIMRPNVDISAGENEYLITVEVPGIDEKDVTLDSVLAEQGGDHTRLAVRGKLRSRGLAYSHARRLSQLWFSIQRR